MANGGDEEYLAGDGVDGETVLGGTTGFAARRKALQERLGAAGARLDGSIAAELAGIEMAEREEKGQALFTAYLLNEISEEYCHEAAGLLGYGQWWGEEERWRLSSVETWKAEPAAGFPCRLTLEGVVTRAEAGPTRPARIEMEVDGGLQVHAFRFQWK